MRLFGGGTIGPLIDHGSSMSSGISSTPPLSADHASPSWM
jgi:hypothetical protein